jgi:hypothetical protein
MDRLRLHYVLRGKQDMAHFAQLDENNVVTRVIVVHNNDCTINGVETEEVGIVFCKTLLGANTKWKQTSYNGNIRKNYAGIGYTYDAGRDAFIPPKPFNSWILNEDTCQWAAPVSYPTDDKRYRWNEETTSWIEITE